MARPRCARFFACFCFTITSAALGATAQAADDKLDRRAASLLDKYCFECHGNDQAEAHINLQAMIAKPDLAGDFKSWQRVVRMLGDRKMPPDYMPQPSNTDRRKLVSLISNQLDRFVREHAGDPGDIVMRRLTSAEYAAAIEDLTGLRLPLDQLLVDDGAGGEGFTNVGDVQFTQDATLERYLDAAKMVAAHAVIGSGPLQFYTDPGQTGRELSAINRIQAIYRAHGFRTAAGEGAEPFGLHLYPEAFFAAWKFRHREILGIAGVTRAQLAAEAGLPAAFLDHIWDVFSAAQSAFPTNEIVTAWRELPVPAGPDEATPEPARAACDKLYTRLRDWQSALAAASGDEEEAAVLTEGNIDVSPKQSLTADIQWPPGAATASVVLSVAVAGQTQPTDSLVIWRNPRVRFRPKGRQAAQEQPFRAIVSPKSADRIAFGHHPSGKKLGTNDFTLQAGKTVVLQLDVPDDSRRAQLSVDLELDRDQPDAGVVRCSVSDGVVEGETAAETGATSALLGDPNAESFAAWKAGVVDFARKLPEVSHREPAPSDRDPIPAPFDATYNSTERNFFHYRVKYHRDDAFFVNYMLDDATRKQLDEAWVDLLTSFEYFDTNLQFAAQKLKLDLQGHDIAALDQTTIDALPPGGRATIQPLYDSYTAAQRALKAAQPGHVQDALGLASRAWRRALLQPEQDRLTSYYNSLRDDAKLDHTKAMRALLVRIFVSPAFLYRAETLPDGPGVAPLSDWELASRLSFFLWSSVPGDDLRQAAEAGQLHTQQQLAEHARRLLRDPNARRLATEFFGQWFGFYRFDSYRGVDAGRFPEFTGALRSAMYDEAVSFFEHVIRNDRPVDEILFADYTFLNRELAQHYGVESDNPLHEQPTRVEDVGRFHRGGLLRLGAVLTATSAPLRTSPVKRGDWILRRVLGTPVPPPPADAGSIPADDVAADGRSVRQRLEAHRRSAACVNCHSRFDPLGFALENFDPVGRWREKYRDGQPIEAAAVMNDGTEIEGPGGLQRYLMQERQSFHRTLSAKLLGFALGRSELATDRPLIEQMVHDIEQGGTFSDLVSRVVTSRQFRYRRGAGGTSPTAATEQSQQSD